MWWIGVIIGVAIGTLLIRWLIGSIKIVGPDEMAIRVIFGKPVAFCESGWVFDLRFPLPGYFKCYLQRYPKKMYNFDYRAREVITQAGNYKDTHYGSQTLKVDSVVYLNFPREKRGTATGDELKDTEMGPGDVEKTHPLIKIVRAQIPVEDKALKDWTEEAVLGALRVSFGKMTWMQAVEDIKKVTEEAEEVFKAADGALIRAGFSKKGIQLVIAEITLPLPLQQAMPNVDRQRLEAEAAIFEAQQGSVETVGTVIEMMAISRGKTADEIKEEIDADAKMKKDFLNLAKDLIVRKIGIDGRSYLDIRVQGAEGLERIFLNALAAWQRMPPGRTGTTGKKGASAPKKQLSDEEYKNALSEATKEGLEKGRG